MNLRRSATEAQLGFDCEHEFKFGVESEFSLEFEFAFEVGFGLECEFEFGLELEFKKERQCKSFFTRPFSCVFLWPPDSSTLPWKSMPVL